MAKPGNYLVRTGTPVSKLIEAAGGLPDDTGKIVSGGPMMGKALTNTDVPVVKGTSGIILFPGKNRTSGYRTMHQMLQNAYSACPILEPYLLMTLSEKGMFERAEKERITDCMECGSCSFICPAGRPLLDYIRLGKTTVIKMARERVVKK